MKVPKARKLPSGTWFIQLRLGGQSYTVNASTEKECRHQAELFKAEYMAGKKIVAKSDKTAAQLMEDYIHHIEGTASPATVRGYWTIQKNRFQAAHGIPAAKVNWQKVIDAEAREKSPKTIKNAWEFLGTSMRFAGLTAPSVRLPQPIPAERPWLDPDEILRFVAAVRGDPVEIPALLALHSLRRSEILGLTWDRIDLKAKTITVRGAVVFGAENKPVAKKTNKNSSSQRVVPIMIPELLDALRVVKDKSGPVCTLHPNTIYRRINSVCKSQGLPEVGIHGLRHSFASLAYHVGMKELECMQLGGWSDPNVMRRIYTHLAAKDRLKAENLMAQFYAHNAKGDVENANEIAN